jgi:hypothetical protein
LTAELREGCEWIQPSGQEIGTQRARSNAWRRWKHSISGTCSADCMLTPGSCYLSMVPIASRHRARQPEGMACAKGAFTTHWYRHCHLLLLVNWLRTCNSSTACCFSSKRAAVPSSFPSNATQLSGSESAYQTCSSPPMDLATTEFKLPKLDDITSEQILP